MERNRAHGHLLAQGYRDVPLVARLTPARSQRFRVTFKDGANAVVNGIELTGAPLVDLHDAKAGYSHRRGRGGGADILRAWAGKWALRERPARPRPLANSSTSPTSFPGRHPCLGSASRTLARHPHRLDHLRPQGRPLPEEVKCYIVDPIGKGAVRNYWSRFPATTLAKHGIKNGGAINAVEFDSWEAGPLNWGPDLAGEFQTPGMPFALSGRFSPRVMW